MNQNEAILYRLRTTRGGLSSWEAAHDPLIRSMRLSGRIKDLREAGYNIRTEMYTDGNKRYARYFLDEATVVTDPNGQFSFVGVSQTERY